MDGKISKKLSENILDKISMDFLRNQVQNLDITLYKGRVTAKVTDNDGKE